MKAAMRLGVLLVVAGCGFQSISLAQAPADNDHTLQAMRDEMARAKTRLELKFPGTNEPVRPYYIEYRLLDLDVRQVVGQFGALMNTAHTRNRFMDVEARVGNYKQDSSNFISDEGFRGFIGSTGSVGIDRDYDSLRQDLWIATDQAFKEAVETYSRKRAYLTSLARQSDIDDFSQATPVKKIEPLVSPDWSNRNWEQEARDSSAALRAFPEINESRVTYYLVYATEYLLTSEGTEIRTNRSFAAIEAGMNTLANDGMELNNFYASYAPKPAELASVDEVKKALNVKGSELMALRASGTALDYTGPVLFDARAAAPLVAQVLGPALNGARPPVAFQPGDGTVPKQHWRPQRLGEPHRVARASRERDGGRRSGRPRLSGQALDRRLQRGRRRCQRAESDCRRWRHSEGAADVAAARAGCDEVQRSWALGVPERRQADDEQSLLSMPARRFRRKS